MLVRGDSLERLKLMDENSMDSVVTDPPYGLKFMGKKWDYDVPSVELWREVYRVLKPGGHVLSFGGTRTYHRMVVNIEDAGFEIRDQLQWIYGSGFPKSHNLDGDWQGFGTALKPANEPIVLARKPLEKGLTVAENVLKWGTGALNIDGCRIDGRERTEYGLKNATRNNSICYGADGTSADFDANQGRWPANVLFDEDAAEMLDEQSGVLKTHAMSATHTKQPQTSMFKAGSKITKPNLISSSGGASRFFYVAKASKRERGEGNNHPTVKPIKLMQYLVKLITPPNGMVLDPFMGSGSTGVACKNLGFGFVGIEIDDSYFEIANKRIQAG